ncbi:hydrolase [Streptomyces sp. HPF1205]|uniref:alpha/beta hydrolase n=1 Tax=Streptomyces sp. HPF1205 TaxID=2873262 RepID=UPI001CEC8BE6|nr:hydrolase [Streptomyces sp. HPF1205]
MPTRRVVLTSAAAAAASAVTAAVPARALAARPSPASPSPSSAAPSAGREGAPGRVRVRLPAPGGPYPVGTVALRLVDTARPDPWVAGERRRELMVSVRYPALEAGRHRLAPQMLPGEAAGFDALNNLSGIPAGRVDWAATRTHAHLGAPPAPGPHPVVLYSPGAGDPRSWNATLVDDLASRGYTVVTVDHTYDATAVEFPDGRVAHTVLPEEYARAVPDPEHPDPVKVAALLKKTMDVRVADTRFVLDALPDALPPRLRAAADFGRTGMFGHSAGGFTALQAMHDDPRLAAGANFDGVLAYVQNDPDRGYLSPVAADGLDRPFLLVGKDGNTRGTVPSWDALWRRSRPGLRSGVTLRGAEHGTFTDAEPLVPQIARLLGLPAATVRGNTGTIGVRRAVTAERALLAAFFDRWLRGGAGRGPHDGGLPRLPGVRPFR